MTSCAFLRDMPCVDAGGVGVGMEDGVREIWRVEMVVMNVRRGSGMWLWSSVLAYLQVSI